MNTGTKSLIALTEEKILAFWEDKGIFQKTLDQTKNGESFVFYDGPPFATGLPHYGHLLGGTMKDVIPRYQTMKGKFVARQWGWDCHGLPVENLIEKKLGISNKQEVEEYGIGKFNTMARDSVLEFEKEWKKTIPRSGRFVDMENPYMTMQPSFTESVWWGFSELHKKNLAYEGFKSMHFCPRCETTLSNFEVNQGYKDITDISVYTLFEKADEEGVYFLAWTTTPWTLPGNVALAVGVDIDYVQIKTADKQLILAKTRLEKITEEYEVIQEMKGSDLVGASYNPPFNYFKKSNGVVDDTTIQPTKIEGSENGWKIYAADFVTTEDGTGIVHIATAFGDDDYQLGQKHNLPFVQHVNKQGKMLEEVTDFAGLYVKPKDNHQATDIEIIKYLAHNGGLYAKEKMIHSYPHCYRCETPLINYATESWFIKVTDMKDTLVAANQTVSWVPENIRDGRFGKWLEGAKDWSISRSRFWGAPMPIWKSESGAVEVIGSIDELKEKTNTSGNIFVMRHGQAEHNVSNTLSSDNTVMSHLTEKGKLDVVHAASKLAAEARIDMIFASPLMRTQETAAIVAGELGILLESVLTDERLSEVRGGDFNGKDVGEYRTYFTSQREKFDVSTPGEHGENLLQMKARLGEFLYEVNETYPDKNILIITHEYGAWLLDAAGQGLNSDESAELKESREDYIVPGEYLQLDFAPLPHNENYELDMHRPYIDEVMWHNADGEEMHRIPDVFDTWVDSGSMSFAQHHFPFATPGETLEEKKENFMQKYYPADFIAEGIDQTRGWFYTLLVMGTSHFGKSPYKNVIVNGLVLAEDGRKMSKSLNNYPPVDHIFETYGADAMRYYLMSSPAVRAEDLAFSEKGVDEIMKKIVMRLYNVLSFYEMYGGHEAAGNPAAHNTNILDTWMISRIAQVREMVTQSLDSYELDKASRPFMDLVDDFSTWYLRRSRDRFKEVGDDATQALQTTRFALIEIAKLFAPFMPFMSEEVYQRTKTDTMPESVHLCSWPEAYVQDDTVLENMKTVREVVSDALQVRSASGIKVRQPLQSVTIASTLVASDMALNEILRDELNVKEVILDVDTEKITIDTVISSELQQEGDARELMRAIQGARKDGGLEPRDVVTLFIGVAGGLALPEFINTCKSDITKTVGAESIVAEPNIANLENSKTLTINEQEITFAIKLQS